VVELVNGAVGGNVAGAAMKENSLGAIGNSLAGIVGGGTAGATFHHAMAHDGIQIICCHTEDKGNWFLAETGMGPMVVRVLLMGAA